MKKNKIISLSACAIALILGVSCGQNEDPIGRNKVSNGNNVQSILEQGMSEAGTENETGSDITVQEDTAPAAAKEPADTPSDAGPAPVPESVPAADVSGGTNEDHIDLTALSGTMVYSEVYNMMYYPENYIGKTVKMSGSYAVYHDESTGKYYHACIISDATACCTQGIEFELTDDYSYPEDYPEEGGEICVEGVFDTYMEGEYTYCILRNAKKQQ